MDIKKRYYSPKEVSIILGVSLGTVYNYISEGYLKCTKLGKKTVRISKKSIERFIKEPL